MVLLGNHGLQMEHDLPELRVPKTRDTVCSSQPCDLRFFTCKVKVIMLVLPLIAEMVKGDFVREPSVHSKCCMYCEFPYTSSLAFVVCSDWTASLLLFLFVLSCPLESRESGGNWSRPGSQVCCLLAL